jgi:hypothetical protein
MLRHTVLLRQSHVMSSRHDAWRMEHDSFPRSFNQDSHLNLRPEQSCLAYIIRVLDARGFRYDIKNGALSCRTIERNVTPRKQCFLGVTFRSIALHGGHHFYNVTCIYLTFTYNA